jgi:hypothetical protein
LASIGSIGGFREIGRFLFTSITTCELSRGAKIEPAFYHFRLQVRPAVTTLGQTTRDAFARRNISFGDLAREATREIAGGVLSGIAESAAGGRL